MRGIDHCISNLPLPGLAGTESETYARWCVRKDSTRTEVRFQPWTRKAAKLLHRHACDFDEQTKRKGRHGGTVGNGAVGPAALKVLRTLIWKFLNPKTGQLDPSYAAIAREAGLCERTVATAIQRLKDLRILDWDRRCEQTMRDGQSVLEQKTNAYHLRPCSGWFGYRKPPEALRPEPGTWGDHPSMPSVLEQAEIERKDGFTLEQRVGTLLSDASDPVALALARLGKAIAEREALANARAGNPQ